MKKLVVSACLAALVSVTCAADAADTISAVKGKVLLVASSQNQLVLKDGKIVPTGYFLDELAVPAQKLIEKGYQVDVATPDGNTPAMDAHSNTASLFGNDSAKLQQALGFVLSYSTMQKPLKLNDVVRTGLSGYAGVYVPGGHAPMTDLMQSPDLGKALQYFHAANKPTAFLCHGPIATLAALQQSAAFRAAMVAGDSNEAKHAANGWQYAGYRMTIYSNSEEYPIEKDVLKGKLPFYVADALRTAGGRVEKGADNTPFVVHDRELITGQNPSSDHLIAETLVKALDEQRIN